MVTMYQVGAGRQQSFPSRSDVDHAEGDGELEPILRVLAAAASAGNSEATETLLYAVDSRHLAEPGIRKIIFEQEDVNDVAQDVLIAVAENIDSYRGDSRFTTWLFTIARYKAINHLRRKRDSVTLRTDLGDAQRISSLIVSDVSIQAMLDQLPDRYRIAVTMRDMQGMAYVDIAANLDLNLNTTRSHIARGRALIAARIREQG